MSDTSSYQPLHTITNNNHFAPSHLLALHDGQRRPHHRRLRRRNARRRSQRLLTQILNHRHGGLHFLLFLLIQVRKHTPHALLTARSLTRSSFVDARPANKFKPNTRFLRNIIKGTDRHNKALLAKEQTEAQARLKDLSDAEEAKRRKYRPSAGEIRGRQLGKITALLSGGGAAPAKRKRPAPADDDKDNRLPEMKRARPASEDKRRGDDTTDATNCARDSKSKRRRSVERYSVRKKDQKDDDSIETTSKRYNISPDHNEQVEEDRKRRRRERDRSRSPRNTPKKPHRHRSPPSETGRHKSARQASDRSSHRRHADEKPAKSRGHDGDKDDADSDPLEDVIGPKPPPKVIPRGRGALRGASAMDSRFTRDYDPKSDVQPDDDARDDWDESLEALRDRAKFRQQGGDRLREAGFTEEQIKKWEKGGEKSVDNVQWTKKGEGREWDRGKEVDVDDDE